MTVTIEPEKHSTRSTTRQARPSSFLHDLGDGPLWTMLSFCTLADIAQLSCTDRFLHELCKEEWILRDAVIAAANKASCCTTSPRQRLRRWAAADACASRAIKAWACNRGLMPQHVFLQPPTEVMVHLYSANQERLLWRGFLPCQRLLPDENENEDNNNTHLQQQQQPSGWRVRLEALAPVWSQFVQQSSSTTDRTRSSSDHLARFVEDLCFVVVQVTDKTTPNIGNSSSSSCCQANLVTCTSGVALCQRPNAAASRSDNEDNSSLPTTFVLRQQWIDHAPVVVHLSIKVHATVLDELQVSYFCVR